MSAALFGNNFVTGHCAVKALELASFQIEISARERRFLLPQLERQAGRSARWRVLAFTSTYPLRGRRFLK